VIRMLKRPEGETIGQFCTATGSRRTTCASTLRRSLQEKAGPDMSRTSLRAASGSTA
jgi:20S proteasome alpha/beta subunit